MVTRDLRFAGCIDATTPTSDADPLPRSTEDRFSMVISVHSDTVGFDLVAQVTKRITNIVSPLVLRAVLDTSVLLGGIWLWLLLCVALYKGS